MVADYDHRPVTVAGKNAVVVGGTSGIGRAIALGFAEEGANVIATSRSADGVAETADELRELGATTAAVTSDVTDRGSIESLRDAAIDALGHVDVLVNSAGAVGRSSLADVTEDDWDHVIDACLDGVYRTSQLFAREMDAGSIVNLSSISAQLSRSNLPAYCAAKSGVDGLTRAAAKELAPEVRVNAIAPGFVMTPLTREAYGEGTAARELVDERTPMQRVAEPGEIVGAAIYLASDAASFTTGEILRVDGGYTESGL